jgi:group I intron endonuclease
MAFVYKATNLVNGKFYIGATDKTVAQRARVHFQKASFGQKSKFYTAIRKYGKSSFEFVTLEECVDFFSALEREAATIKMLKPEYNLTSGGGGVKGFKFTDASKIKMSKAKKGRPAAWLSGPNVEEIRKTLSEKAKARKGKYLLSNDRKQELRKYARIMAKKTSKPVRCLNDLKEFTSANAAVRFYDLKTVHLLAHSGRQSRNGLRFEFIK